MRKVFLDQMRREDTLWTALVVGTLINLYGQVLVPLARGSTGIFSEFLRNLEQAWERIVGEVGREGTLTSPESIYFAPARRWYAAAASAAPDGVNVYLAAIPPPMGRAWHSERTPREEAA